MDYLIFQDVQLRTDDLPFTTVYPLVDFHHRLTACPSYQKKGVFKNIWGLMKNEI